MVKIYKPYYNHFLTILQNRMYLWWICYLKQYLSSTINKWTNIEWHWYSLLTTVFLNHKQRRSNKQEHLRSSRDMSLIVRNFVSRVHLRGIRHAISQSYMWRESLLPTLRMDKLIHARLHHWVYSVPTRYR